MKLNIWGSQIYKHTLGVFKGTRFVFTLRTKKIPHKKIKWNTVESLCTCRSATWSSANLTVLNCSWKALDLMRGKQWLVSVEWHKYAVWWSQITSTAHETTKPISRADGTGRLSPLRVFLLRALPHWQLSGATGAFLGDLLLSCPPYLQGTV